MAKSSSRQSFTVLVSVFPRPGVEVSFEQCLEVALDCAAEHSIENNTVRPWVRVCKCGYELYEEKLPYPTFSPASSRG